MSREQTVKAVEGVTDRPNIISVIQRIEALNAHQARAAFRIYVTNNPGTLQAVADALDIAESYRRET